MVVEPNAVSAAMPTAMPIIRATVTVADAAPNAARPAASTAAVDRGVTVSPNPKPKTAADAAKASVGAVGLHADIHTRPPRSAPARPESSGGGEQPSQEARQQRAQGHGPGEGAEHPLAAPPDRRRGRGPRTRPRHDRRGQAVAGQQRDERGELNTRSAKRRGSRKGSGRRRPWTTAAIRDTTPAAKSAPIARAMGTPKTSSPLPTRVVPNRTAARPTVKSSAPSRSTRAARGGCPSRSWRPRLWRARRCRTGR